MLIKNNLKLFLLTILAWNLVVVQTAIPPTCHTYIKIESDGRDSTALTTMYLNGVQIYQSPDIGGSQKTRGIHVVLLNRLTHEIKGTEVFDTYESSAEPDRFKDYIYRIRSGDYALIGFSGETTRNLQSNAITYLKSKLGSTQDSFNLNDSFVLMGSKNSDFTRFQNVQASPNTASVEGCIAEKYQENCYKYVNVESGALFDYEIFRIHLNYEQQSYSTISRGLNVMILDKDTYEEKDFQVFDTWAQDDANDSFVNFFDAFNHGDIVVLGINDEAVQKLQQSGKDKLKSLGGPSSLYLETHYSFTLIGAIGLGEDNGISQTNIRHGGGSHSEKCLKECDVKCVACSTSPGNCTECVTGGIQRTEVQPQCGCNPGYFEVDSNTLNCSQCQYPCEECTSLTQCVTCKTTIGRVSTTDCNCDRGYYEEGTRCEKYTCTEPCVLCNSSQSECYECNQVRYFDSNSDLIMATCDSCPQYCNKCTSLTICTECLGNNRNVNDLCSPNPGFYNKSGQNDAEPCISPCQNCSSHNICNSCRGSNRSGVNCDADPTYYVKSGQENAEPCVSPCLNCISESQCSSCRGSNRSGANCDADPTYFVKSGQENGEPCVSPCLNCISESQCSSCRGSNRSGSNCDADPGFYVKAGQENAEPCVSPCQNCSSESICLSCRGTNRSGQNCEANPGYYLRSGQENAEPCVSPCQNCNSETECISCRGSNRTGENCVADPGYYVISGQENAEPCLSPCQNCSSSSECLSCRGTNRSGSSCDALPTFYVKSEQENAEPCVSPCVNCQSESHCLSCIDSHFHSVDSCILCDYKCDGCTGPGGANCKLCQGENRDQSNNCECETGYFENSSNECQKCPLNCKSCSNETQCDSCPTDDNNRNDNPPLCSCKTYFEQNSLGKCQSSTCNYQKCATCMDGPEDCIDECHSSCGSCNTDTTCKSCSIGKYLNQGLCEPCNSKCYACDSQDKDICLMCASSEEGRLDIDQNCACQEGYFENPLTQKCTRCEKANCKVCNYEGICEECLNPELSFPECEENTKGTAPIKIFDETQNKEVVVGKEKCDPKCQTCSLDSKTCDFCAYGENRNLQKPCLCKEGYHDNNGLTRDCYKCPKYCEKCNEDSECIKCKEGIDRVLSRFTGLCECKKGFKTNSTLECQRCFSYQGDCVLVCPQNTIADDILYLCKEKGYLRQDNLYLIYISTFIIVLFLIFAKFVFYGKLEKNFRKIYSRNINKSLKY